MSALKIRTATDVGRVRQNNEDAFWVRSRCLAVCDGMGGHLAGEVASRLAVEALEDYCFADEDPLLGVRGAIEYAQERILKRAAENENWLGMGTTMTLACLDPLTEGGARLSLGHVGDSRGYVFFEGRLKQLTQDHSVVGELVRAGTITAEEARHHAKRHVLTQALGSGQIEIELIRTELPPGALVLLCTDGLTDVASDEKIAQIMAQAHDFENAAQELVDLANRLGGPDNITVVLVELS